MPAPYSQTWFHKEIVPILQEKLQKKNPLAVPRVEKIVVNVGCGPGLKDAKFWDVVEATLRRITGQKPVKTLARTSVSSFKIRRGMPVGMMVTLRGPRAWHFLDKLVHVAFARVRDFRGLPDSTVDMGGNFSYGFREVVAFPEMTAEDADVTHGLQVTVVTTTKSRAEGRALFEALGFPFKTRPPHPPVP